MGLLPLPEPPPSFPSLGPVVSGIEPCYSRHLGEVLLARRKAMFRKRVPV